MCHCKWTEIILSLVILVLAFWESSISWLPSKWVIVASAGILLIHTLLCKNHQMCCGNGKSMSMPKKSKKKAKKKRSRRKKRR